MIDRAARREEVVPGAAADMPKGTFTPLDRVIAVDGKEGRAAELLQMLSDIDAPKLKLRLG